MTEYFLIYLILSFAAALCFPLCKSHSRHLQQRSSPSYKFCSGASRWPHYSRNNLAVSGSHTHKGSVRSCQCSCPNHMNGCYILAPTLCTWCGGGHLCAPTLLRLSSKRHGTAFLPDFDFLSNAFCRNSHLKWNGFLFIVITYLSHRNCSNLLWCFCLGCETWCRLYFPRFNICSIFSCGGFYRHILIQALTASSFSFLLLLLILSSSLFPREVHVPHQLHLHFHHLQDPPPLWSADLCFTKVTPHLQNAESFVFIQLNCG